MSVTNYDEFKVFVNSDIVQIGQNVTQIVKLAVERLKFDKILSLVGFFDTTASGLDGKIDEFKGNFQNLTDQAQQINEDLKSLGDEMERYCNASVTPVPNCDQIVTDINAIQLSIDDLPDVNQFDDVQINDGVLAQISELKKTLNDARASIDKFSDDFIQDNIAGINTTLNEVGKTVKKNVQNILDGLDSLDLMERYKEIENDLLQAQDLFDYVFYGFVAFGLFLGNISFKSVADFSK